MNNDLIRLLEIVYQTCKTRVWRKINFLDDLSDWAKLQTPISLLVYLSVVYVMLKNISLVWRCHHCLKRVKIEN